MVPTRGPDVDPYRRGQGERAGAAEESLLGQSGLTLELFGQRFHSRPAGLGALVFGWSERLPLGHRHRLGELWTGMLGELPEEDEDEAQEEEERERVPEEQESSCPSGTALGRSGHQIAPYPISRSFCSITFA
ncbi:hypothetical protein ADK55_05920 [Streptomyces sp. WM4235]|nr:hypothetical protein ADK55_05920 [Streptomyces sp. WM4235]